MVVRLKAEEACRDLADRWKWGEARSLEGEEDADFCAEWQRVLKGKQVSDFGCGTGLER